jgi:DNA-binding NtrC family response regulator
LANDKGLEAWRAVSSMFNKPLALKAVRKMRLALVIEDEPEYAAFAVAAFDRFGFQAFAVESVASAIENLECPNNLAAILINLTTEKDELDLVNTVTARWPKIKIILLSAHLRSLRELPPSIFLAKPTTAPAIIGIIEHVTLAMGSDCDSPKARIFH